LKVFDLYVNHFERQKSHISFFQFWNDFLLNYMISEGKAIEETFQKIRDKWAPGLEQKEVTKD
jgi:hypothetical protein